MYPPDPPKGNFVPHVGLCANHIQYTELKVPRLVVYLRIHTFLNLILLKLNPSATPLERDVLKGIEARRRRCRSCSRVRERE